MSLICDVVSAAIGTPGQEFCNVKPLIRIPKMELRSGSIFQLIRRGVSMSGPQLHPILARKRADLVARRNKITKKINKTINTALSGLSQHPELSHLFDLCCCADRSFLDGFSVLRFLLIRKCAWAPNRPPKLGQRAPASGDPCSMGQFTACR